MIDISELDNWLINNFDKIKGREFISEHIYVGNHLSSLAIDQISLTFMRLVELLDGMSASKQICIVIPLKPFDEPLIGRAPSSRTEFIHNISDLEPISIYLFDAEISKYRDPVEEYIAPLPFDITHIESDSTLVYYREHRDSEGMRYNWEYSRSVYLKYFPKIYR